MFLHVIQVVFKFLKLINLNQVSFHIIYLKIKLNKKIKLKILILICLAKFNNITKIFYVVLTFFSTFNKIDLIYNGARDIKFVSLLNRIVGF
jgi:hypothetical protein